MLNYCKKTIVFLRVCVCVCVCVIISVYTDDLLSLLEDKLRRFVIIDQQYSHCCCKTVTAQRPVYITVQLGAVFSCR